MSSQLPSLKKLPFSIIGVATASRAGSAAMGTKFSTSRGKLIVVAAIDIPCPISPADGDEGGEASKLGWASGRRARNVWLAVFGDVMFCQWC